VAALDLPKRSVQDRPALVDERDVVAELLHLFIWWVEKMMATFFARRSRKISFRSTWFTGRTL